MTMLFVGFLFCLAVVFTIVVMDRLGERWRRLHPHFRYNYVGGVLAICSSTDYAKGRKLERSGGKSLIVAPETVVFSNNKGSYFSGRVRSHYQWLEPEGFDNFYPRDKAENLFVPFVSEKYLPLAEQERLFVPGADTRSFAERKQEENRKVKPALRFADWELATTTQNRLGNVQLFASIVAVLLLLVIIGAGVARDNMATANEVVTIYITSLDQEAVQETRVTRREARQLLINDGYGWRLPIYKGRLMSLTNLGGGSTLACAQASSENIRCGFADSSLKLAVGNAVYLRPGNILWRHDKNFIDKHRNFSWWVITEKEAFALRDRGLKIEE